MTLAITTNSSLKYDTLTPREAVCIGILRVFLDGPGRPPAIEEIARFLNSNRKAAHRIVSSLERKGYVSRTRGKYRSLQLTDKKLPYSTFKPKEVAA